jgi:hypothetical protein
LAAILRIKRGRHFYYTTTGALSLAFAYHHKSVPTSISYTFCKMMVLQKIGYIQVFKCYLVMTENPSFASPQPPLSEMTAAIKEISTAYTEAQKA